jgi:L-lactate dehydrogenase complex protein LldF
MSDLRAYSEFSARICLALANPQLQANLRKAKGKFVLKRSKGIAELDDFEALRSACRDIRERVLDRLGDWLERFEERASARGAQVLWARDGAEICAQVLEIARRHEVRKVVKSKSMLSEEADLNAALAAAGIESIETDLGEYIIQLAGEKPSHIIAPAVHKSLDEVADLFCDHHARPRQTDIPALAREARAVLREHFLSADMGISGGNFLVAETGSVALVTNEGNGRMVTTRPRVHVVITGIEKVVPDLADLATLLRLLPRSATGQSISNYVSLLTGTRQASDTDGPEATYFILVDNGRSELLGDDFQAMLRCIRCGACMNHCPVYQSVGGHAYGWVYPGPMGSVLTPLLTRGAQGTALASATTGCGQCAAVCPVGIPLPDLMARLREREATAARLPRGRRLGLALWRRLVEQPRLYAAVAALAARLLRLLGGRGGQIARLPFAAGWSDGRDLSAPPGRTFRELYRSSNGARNHDASY